MLDESTAKALARSILNCYVEHMPPGVYESVVSDVGREFVRVRRETASEVGLAAARALRELTEVGVETQEKEPNKNAAVR